MDQKQLEMRNVILYFSHKYNGNWHAIYRAIKTREKTDIETTFEVASKIKSKTSTILDDDYPNSLKKMSNPPFVIYYYGNLSLLDDKTIFAIWGDENGSAKIRQLSETMAIEINQQNRVLTVIDGALNDSIAYAAADYGGVIAVGIAGIEYVKSQHNELSKENIINLLLSEFPGMIEPDYSRKLATTRLVSALSTNMIVTDLAIGSYLLNGIIHNLENGKRVFIMDNAAKQSKEIKKVVKQLDLIEIQNIKEVQYIIEAAQGKVHKSLS